MIEIGYAPVSESTYKVMFYIRSEFLDDFLKIHIHTEIAWNDIVYFDKDDIFGHNFHLQPVSREDELAILIPHLFFEHEKIRLSDVLRGFELMSGAGLDYTYIEDISRDHTYATSFFFHFLADIYACLRADEKSVMAFQEISFRVQAERTHRESREM